MNTLMGVGLACMLAAAAGGGLEALGVKFPLLTSLSRQILVGLLGVGIFSLGWVSEHPAAPAGNEPDGKAATAAAVEGAVSKPPSTEAPRTREPAGGAGDDPAPTPGPAPEPEDISGTWNDANGAKWELDQDGSEFTFASVPPSSTEGDGEIDGKDILLRVSLGGVPHTCSLRLSENGSFITGRCQSTAEGNASFELRWYR